MTATPIHLLKGHGTGNDFVLVPDGDAEFELTDDQVARLCDRRMGLGADGVLRVVRSEQCPEVANLSADAEWFMDHRNPDGSRPEMCGNGIRLFARYLVDSGLAGAGTFSIATRGGLQTVTVPESGDVTVEMGAATTPRLRAMPIVEVPGGSWNATGVICPNPHAVVFVHSLDEAGDLRDAPVVVPGGVFPDGVNVEFVVVHEPGHLSMRVHERGVGETLSCGTGAVAAVWAARRHEGDPEASPATWIADVPGGRLRVTEQADGSLDLTGPAVVVGSIELADSWWGSNSPA